MTRVINSPVEGEVVSGDSWVPGGGGECQDRRKGGPAVIREQTLTMCSKRQKRNSP